MPIYMQFDGISGSVTAQDYKNWIELNSVSFGASRFFATKTGNVADREYSKPAPPAIFFLKLALALVRPSKLTFAIPANLLT